MLTFLRKIRKSLIDSGSTRKYLIYAVGEIALVVLGILIALHLPAKSRRQGLITGIRTDWIKFWPKNTCSESKQIYKRIRAFFRKK